MKNSFYGNSMKWSVVLAAVVLAGCAKSPFDDEWGARSGGGKGRGEDKKGYTISVGASSGQPAMTRATFDGVDYKWSPGDRVGFYMTPQGSATPIIGNARLASTLDSPGMFTHFEGDITGTQIMSIDPAAKYDYYSYFPYDGEAPAGSLDVQFEIPGEMNLTPDIFPMQYGFMVAAPVATADGERPVSYIEGGEQHHGKRVEFQYRHVFAYLEVYLALNLMSQPVNKIVVTCVDGSPMWGTANIDITTGAIAFTGGTNVLTINIGGNGLDIRSATDYDKIYIPINPALAGKEFRFEFHSAQGNSSTQTVTGGALVAGNKHKAGLKVPFRANFYDTQGPNEWDSDKFGNIFTHKGYDFWCWKMNPNWDGGTFNLIPFSGGTLSFDGDGEVRTPEIQLDNALGLTNVNVRVTILASGNDPLIWPFNNGQRMKYGICDLAVATFSEGEFVLSFNDLANRSFDAVLTPAKHCVAFKSNAWGAYYNWIQEIKIEPR